MTRSKTPAASDDLPKPRRPLSAFFIYLQQNRAQLKQRFPNLSTAELARKAGEEWKNMAKETKDVYFRRANDAKAEYQRQLAEYEQQQGKLSKPAKRVLSPAAGGVSKKRPKKDPGTTDKRRKPKPPANDKKRKPKVPANDKKRKPKAPANDKKRKPKAPARDKKRKPKAPAGDKKRKPKAPAGDKKKKPKAPAGGRRTR